MYKDLLVKCDNQIYLDCYPIEVNDEVKPYYFDIIIAKLINEGIDYQLIKTEETTNNCKEIIEKIMINEKNFNDIKKNTYLFTEIACKTDLINDINVTDFSNISLALDYSTNICRRYNEYHLIKRNNVSRYSVHLTFEKYNMNELEKGYEDKVLKKIK